MNISIFLKVNSETELSLNTEVLTLKRLEEKSREELAQLALFAKKQIEL